MRLIPKETIQKYSQTAGERNEIDEILKPVLLAQRIYGLQIFNPEWSWKKYGINRIYNFLLCVYVGIGTIDVCMNTEKLNLIIEGVITLLVNVQLVFKSLLFASHYRNFQKNYFKAKIYIYDLIKHSPKKRDRIIRSLKLLVKTMAFMVIFTLSAYLMRFLWFGFNGNRVTLSRSTSTLMPMTTPYYELGLLFHAYYVVEAAFCLLVIDLWFIFMCFFFFEASEVSVEILDVKRNGDSDDLYAKRLDDALREFYILHVEMMEYLNLINDMFKWICLVPIVAILIDTSLFLFLLKEEINIQVGTIMIPGSGEMFIYNWFGERINSTVVKINMAFLHFDWTSMKLKDQKKYFIIACYMNKNFSVKTAVGNDLSLLTLSSIYKASYQMFTVFNSIN